MTELSPLTTPSRTSALVPALASIEAAPEAARAELTAVQRALGRVPNLFLTVAHSAPALHAYVTANEALARGRLGAALREGIALRVAELDHCEYCTAAHSYLGTHAAQLPADELLANRAGASSDARRAAALSFVGALVEARGHVDPSAVLALREAGYGAAELVEIVLAVAVNVFTNYLNSAVHTALDFPEVAALSEGTQH